MDDMARAGLRHLFIGAAASLAVGFGGVRQIGYRQPLTAPLLTPSPDNYHRVATRDECDNLKPPAGTRLAAHYYATGVQIYRWIGSAWTLVGPRAVLFADSGRTRKAGTHYAGPAWQTTGGSKVVGRAAQRCSPDSTAIPWLSLDAVSSDSAGDFRRVTFIQRGRTVGGVAPSAAGTSAGEEASVPYSAEYLFYRTD